MPRACRILFLLMAAYAVFAVAVSCGLKGPPIPPDVTGTPGVRSGAGALQFGPKEQKVEEEDKRILELYGKKQPKKSDVPGANEALGLGAVGESDKAAESWIQWQNEIEDQVAKWPTPPPEKTDQATPAPEGKSDAATPAPEKGGDVKKE